MDAIPLLLLQFLLVPLGALALVWLFEFSPVSRWSWSGLRQWWRDRRKRREPVYTGPERRRGRQWP